ncbi:hypothetical protein [Rubellimicrobium arenae]|uniref:hypothetical protein n=1 Tax=Rubellimicrobium arenae TaxID=2817372 RepID=UPI001B301830|nr:hypothetical protein [Rubellimicrobium arenae]
MSDLTPIRPRTATSIVVHPVHWDFEEPVITARVSAGAAGIAVRDPALPIGFYEDVVQAEPDDASLLNIEKIDALTLLMCGVVLLTCVAGWAATVSLVKATLQLALG